MRGGWGGRGDEAITVMAVMMTVMGRRRGRETGRQGIGALMV